MNTFAFIGQNYNLLSYNAGMWLIVIMGIMAQIITVFLLLFAVKKLLESAKSMKSHDRKNAKNSFIAVILILIIVVLIS